MTYPKQCVIDIHVSREREEGIHTRISRHSILSYCHPCIETMGHRYTQDNASVTSYTGRHAFIYVTWRIHIHAVTHSYTCRDAFIYMPWRIHIHAVTHSYTCFHSSIYVTRLLHVDAMTPSYRYGVATISRLLKMIGLLAECRSLL